MNYEICGLCESLHPSDEMETLMVTDPATRTRKPLRFCRSCLHPTTTYIQGSWLSHLNVQRDLVASAVTVAGFVILAVLFGALMGPPLGSVLMLAGILTGAVLLVALVVASCMPHY